MIAPFGLRHIWLVHQLQNTCTTVDLRSALLDEPARPLHAALRGYFLKSRLGTFTYVLQAPDHDTELRGFAQARGHPSGLVWHLVRMAPALDCQAAPSSTQAEEAATVWYRLLLHLCIAAGEHRVQRLFAWVPADGPAEEVFRQAGFARYCHEQLFWLPPANAGSGTQSARVCPLQPENQYEVQRLYHRVTPRLVLQAEELNSQNGALIPCQIYLDSEQGYAVHGHNGEMEGYLHIAAGPRGICLRLLTHPDASNCAAELLDHALAVLNRHLSRPLYCVVRDYEGSLQNVLEERGFALANVYSLLVKHTTVHVKESARKLVPTLEKKAEIAPTVSLRETG